MKLRSPHRRTGIVALLALFLTLAAAVPPVRAADDAGSWHVRHPVPWNQVIVLAVAEAGDRIRAYGDGTMVESADGRNWTMTPISPAVDFYMVARGPNGYVATDSSDVYSSTDGIHWTKRLSGGYDVEYIGGRYIAYGAKASQVSTDGITWTYASGGPASYGVAYGDGHYVATAWNENTVYHSADGLTWEKRGKLDAPLLSIAYDNGRWLGIYQDSSAVAVSEDGLTWERVQLEVEPQRLMAGGGRFVVQAVRDFKLVLLTSTDGRVWSEQPAPDPVFLPKGYRDGYYLAFSSQGYYRSWDGVAWTPLTGWHRGDMLNAAYGQGRWVAVGQGGTLVTSPDGVTWTDRDLETQGDLNAVIYAAGRFVAVGEGGIWSSPTGLVWTLQTDGRGFTTVEYGGGRFLALGDKNAWYSVDGSAWIKTRAPDHFVTKVAYGNGRFVAVGSPAFVGGENIGYAYTTADGRNWTTVELPTAVPFEVAFNGQIFVAVGSMGYVLTSTDGVTWSLAQPYEELRYNSVIAVDGEFIATGRHTRTGEPLLAYSMDGLEWSLVRAPARFALTAVADGRLLGLGDHGRIYDLVDPARPTPACEPPLADVSVYNPACQAVEDLFAAKIVQGRGTQGFVPEGQLSRAEFATMLVRAMGWTAPAGQTMSFSDLKESHWASGAIQAAVAHGAFSGFPDGTFKPDLPISRSELVKIAAAVAGLKPEGSAGYTDVASKDWFSGWVAAARTNGLIGPDAGGALWADPYFYGREAATRNEAALLLWNLMNRSK